MTQYEDALLAWLALHAGSGWSFYSADGHLAVEPAEQQVSQI